MRRGALLLGLVLIGCGPTENPPLEKTATLEGQFDASEGLGGDAWIFLYRPGEGPPGLPAVPVAATAIPAERYGRGDHRYVMADVPPNPWRLWGLLDVDGNFDPSTDVLAQAGAGDRVGEGVELNVQPGRVQQADLRVDTLIRDEPPAFRIEGTPADVTLDDASGVPVPVTLVSDAAGGRLDPKRTAFVFTLVDANGDRLPDDVNGDGVPDLSFTAFLRWLPLPGQLPKGHEVIVLLAPNPAPILASLDGDLSKRVLVDRIQLFPVPQAQELDPEATGAEAVRPFGAPPRGEYELVVVTATGQFWRMPNHLGADLPEQATRFHFDRAQR